MTAVATQNDRDAAARRRPPVLRLPGLWDALWYRRSVRAQLLLTVLLIELIAALATAGVTILKARTSTRIEIDASMNLAEVLVREAINLMPADTPADRFLESLPLQQRFAKIGRASCRERV